VFKASSAFNSKTATGLRSVSENCNANTGAKLSKAPTITALGWILVEADWVFSETDFNKGDGVGRLIDKQPESSIAQRLLNVSILMV